MQFGSYIKENNPEVLIITINEQPFKEVTKTLFQKHLQFPYKCSSWEEAKQWFDSLEYRLAKKYVFFLLSRRDYPSEILRHKLFVKRISQKTMEKVIEELQKLHYIDDEKWIQKFIDYQLKKGYGPYNITAKLQQKKISLSTIEPLIQKMVTVQQQKTMITNLLKKDFATFSKEKIMRLLQQRGFDPFVIVETVKTLHGQDNAEKG